MGPGIGATCCYLIFHLISRYAQMERMQVIVIYGAENLFPRFSFVPFPPTPMWDWLGFEPMIVYLQHFNSAASHKAPHARQPRPSSGEVVGTPRGLSLRVRLAEVVEDHIFCLLFRDQEFSPYLRATRRLVQHQELSRISV